MTKLLSLYRSLNNCMKLVSCPQVRTFLSESFDCQESWKKRLESPILKKVNLEEMYLELDGNLGRTGKVSAIDVDIFSNAVNDDSHLDEMEDLVHKFRLSSEASNILPSTHHAFIRTFHSFGDPEELLRILNDRLNYGIFPDDYCSLLLMNSFIKSGDFRNAAKVGILHMLQEDFSNRLILYLSLYSCHKYILNPCEWEKQETVSETEAANDDDEEEIYVRVKYLRNPYFDDHFDLRNPEDLIGKTLLSAGQMLNDELGRSYQLIGASLYKKWGQVESCLNDILQNKLKVFKESISMVEESLLKIKIEEGDSAKEKKKQIDALNSLVYKLKTSELLLSEDMLKTTEERVKQEVSNSEEKLISHQCQVYSDWEDSRQRLLYEELAKLKQKARIAEVNRKKSELERREEELFFFDRENELELKIESKRVPYPPKWHGKKKPKRQLQADYTPPTVERRTSD